MRRSKDGIFVFPGQYHMPDPDWPFPPDKAKRRKKKNCKNNVYHMLPNSVRQTIKAKIKNS